MKTFNSGGTIYTNKGAFKKKIIICSSVLIPKMSTRAVVLNSKLAAEIYEKKISLILPDSFESCLTDSRSKMRGMSAKLCRRYGVSAKTVRDIWNRRTWTSATRHLWNDDVSIPQVFVFCCANACSTNFLTNF